MVGASDAIDRRFRRLLGATVGLTYVLVLLGVYTAAEGAGLTCAGRWPLCDGAVFGLFPANWPSFVEWFHRLVAMTTGLLILASAVAAWRTAAPRRVVAVLWLATILLPIQIVAGAQTVLTYEVLVLTAHFLLALVIYSVLLVGLLWTLAPDGLPARAVERGLPLGLAISVPFTLFGPRLVFVHTGPVQVAYYGLGLLLWSILVAAVLGRQTISADRQSGPGWLEIGLPVSLLVLGTKLLAGRLVYSPTVRLIDWAATVLLVVALGAMTLVLRSRRRGLRSSIDGDHEEMGVPDRD